MLESGSLGRRAKVGRCPAGQRQLRFASTRARRERALHVQQFLDGLQDLFVVAVDLDCFPKLGDFAVRIEDVG